MIQREPTKSKIILKTVWKQLKRDKIEMFQKAWDLIEPNEDLLSSESEYQEWESNSNHYSGLRHKHTKKRHGLVRTELFFFIHESSYKNDKIHGL